MVSKSLDAPKFQDDIGFVAVLTPPEGYVVLLLVETKDLTTADFYGTVVCIKLLR